MHHRLVVRIVPHVPSSHISHLWVVWHVYHVQHYLWPEAHHVQGSHAQLVNIVYQTVCVTRVLWVDINHSVTQLSPHVHHVNLVIILIISYDITSHLRFFHICSHLHMMAISISFNSCMSIGSYSAISAATTCTSCSVASYQPSFGGTSCLLCNDVNITGSYYCPSIPIICEAGQYVNTSAHGGCNSCRAGISSHIMHADHPIRNIDIYHSFTIDHFMHCQWIGSYQSLPSHGSTACELCSSGSYQLWDAQHKCYECPEHWYTQRHAIHMLMIIC